MIPVIVVLIAAIIYGVSLASAGVGAVHCVMSRDWDLAIGLFLLFLILLGLGLLALDQVIYVR